MKEDIFIEQYIQYILKMDEAMKENDYKTNNKYAIKLNKLNNKYQNESYYVHTLDILMNNKNLKVASNAAIDSLRYNCNINKAIKVLKDISNKDLGITGFTAGIALKIWQEKGAKGIM